MYSLLYNSLFTHVASNELKSSFKIPTIYVKYVYSQLYYYNPNKTDYRIYIHVQFSTVCSYYTEIYNSKLHSFVELFTIIYL